jgi:UMP-CMP kinase
MTVAEAQRQVRARTTRSRAAVVNYACILALAAASPPRPSPAPQAANGAPAAAATAPAPAPAYKIAFVLGGPGSGKGTQCARLVAEFGVVHLSAGDLLRAHMASGSPEGGMVAEMIAQGQIVPSRVTVSLLRAAMDASAAAGRAAFLIDGFPRNDENRGSFEAVTGLRPACVLFFDCPEAEMTRRLLARQEGRTDDNEDTIRKRFRVYQGSTMPVIAHYEKAGIVARVGADRPVEEVYKEARRAYLELMT